jgi:peptidoglycan/LPS O-acetylase OafA/YrhL
MAVKQDEIRPLTTFRAVAAALVFGSHYYPYVPDFSPWLCLFAAGSTGVDMFFALSGFLFTLRYADDVWRRRFRWRVYLKRRIARIWPLYLFVLFLSALLGLEITLINIFLIQGLFDAIWASGVAPAWSLTVEEMFYLLFPGLLLTLKVTPKNRNTLIRRLAVLFAWVFALYAAGAGLYWLSHQTGLARLFLLSNWGHITQQTLFGLMLDFVIGIGFGLIYNRFGAPSPRTAIWIVALGFIGLVACWAWLVRDVSFNGNVFYTPPHHAVALFSGLMLLGLSQTGTPVARVMSVAPLVYLGRISFAFYLVNLTPIIAFGVRFPLLVFYAIANGICVLLYQGVEKPMQRFINRQF